MPAWLIQLLVQAVIALIKMWLESREDEQELADAQRHFKETGDSAPLFALRDKLKARRRARRES